MSSKEKSSSPMEPEQVKQIKKLRKDIKSMKKKFKRTMEKTMRKMGRKKSSKRKKTKISRVENNDSNHQSLPMKIQGGAQVPSVSTTSTVPPSTSKNITSSKLTLEPPKVFTSTINTGKLPLELQNYMKKELKFTVRQEGAGSNIISNVM